ncbi:MAG: hypothetical protein ACFFCP_04200 [Promethearchaeota archaeon]
MSGKPTGVVILAILQLISALMVIYGAVVVLMVTAIFGALISVILLIIGIIGLILFYGLWTLKSWAWIWTLLANLLTLVLGLLGDLGSITNWISIAISAIIVIYMLMPSTRAYFK